MKKLLLLIMMVVTTIGSAYAIIDKYTIDRDDLPEEAQKMLKEYFPKAKVGMIKVDKHLLKKTDYDVRLVSGTTIEFNNKGKWTSVDCKKRAVPDDLIIKPIRNHVKNNYPDTKIVKIERDTSGYEIKLSDGVKLKYNLLGIFKKVADIDDPED